jgi:hypothetical protein
MNLKVLLECYHSCLNYYNTSQDAYIDSNDKYVIVIFVSRSLHRRELGDNQAFSPSQQSLRVSEKQHSSRKQCQCDNIKEA